MPSRRQSAPQRCVWMRDAQLAQRRHIRLSAPAIENVNEKPGFLGADDGRGCAAATTAALKKAVQRWVGPIPDRFQNRSPMGRTHDGSISKSVPDGSDPSQVDFKILPRWVGPMPDRFQNRSPMARTLGAPSLRPSTMASGPRPSSPKRVRSEEPIRPCVVTLAGMACGLRGKAWWLAGKARGLRGNARRLAGKGIGGAARR